ncbi:hypothetical protein BpHYR1_044854 [Brachionus plicatilis]|uniref:Uncharacterized protein n=1 Tax=Brachionus plicatilis TaxID=10195 RepID=A0A3M7QV95_BRAPC|nr:hypothetical protein BpHYR1_044854 [Brachionus plicatilis]
MSLNLYRKLSFKKLVDSLPLALTFDKFGLEVLYTYILHIYSEFSIIETRLGKKNISLDNFVSFKIKK